MIILVTLKNDNSTIIKILLLDNYSYKIKCTNIWIKFLPKKNSWKSKKKNQKMVIIWKFIAILFEIS